MNPAKRRTASPPAVETAREIVLCIAAASIYGAVLGSWHGAQMALFAAIKLPLLLLATATLSAPLFLLLSRTLGTRLGFAASALLAVRALSRAALLLASLAPVAALFTWSAPAPDPAARTTHNVLYLTHTTLVGVCGLFGTFDLRARIRAVAPTPLVARGLLFAWVTLFALVGGELAWALRPFVGSVYEPVAFLRSDALDGNVYEFIWTDIRPHLASRLFHGGVP